MAYIDGRDYPCIAAISGVFTLFATWSDAAFGPRSAHMASHILIMNAIAPLSPIGLARFQAGSGIFASDSLSKAS